MNCQLILFDLRELGLGNTELCRHKKRYVRGILRLGCRFSLQSKYESGKKNFCCMGTDLGWRS